MNLSLGRTLILSSTLLPPLLLGLLIVKYGVDVPYWDQWEIAPFFEKFAQGSLSFTDVFAQQNEYRQLFPNLIFIALGWVTAWDVRYEMLVSFLLACFISFNIYRLGKLTLKNSPKQRLLLFSLSNIVIFSPIQYENWLFGIQIIYFMPIACITTSLLIIYSGINLMTKFLICVFLSMISTFSSANGILCWTVIIPFLFLPGQKIKFTIKIRLISIWALIFLLNVFLYLHGYQKPENHPSLSEVLIHPINAILYFLGFFSTPLGISITPIKLVNDYKIFIATPIGIILITIFLLSCLYLLKFSTTSALYHDTFGWLAIAFYAIMTGIMVTIGRSGFGIWSAFSLRYTTFSLYFLVALINLTAIILDDAKKKNYSWNNILLYSKFASIFAGMLILVHIGVYSSGIYQMSRLRISLLQGKACLLFINFIQDGYLTKKIYPNLDVLQHRANALNNLGFLRPALVASRRLQEIDGAHDQSVEEVGVLESVAQIGEQYVSSGWAVLPDRGEPADAILLAYEKAEGGSIVFALATTEGKTDGAARQWGKGARRYGHWQKTFLLSELPRNPVELSAWAFDAAQGKALKLKGTFTIANSE